MAIVLGVMHILLSTIRLSTITSPTTMKFSKCQAAHHHLFFQTVMGMELQVIVIN